MKEAFDYGDLEQVAERVMSLIYAHVENETLTWSPEWNRARVVTEAVQSVAFPSSAPR